MRTIKDVSKLAKVSVGSVSKYLNGYKLKDKTREAIESAIKELNYEPNIYAKGLKTNRTNTVVLIVPTVWHPFFSELTYYIELELQRYQMKLIICNTRDEQQKEIEFFAMARQNKVDGIIAITYSNIDDYIDERLPVVSIDRFFSTTTDFISSDNYYGGFLGAEKLVASGCHKIAYIGHSSSFTNDPKSRLDGFKKYCVQHDIPFDICYSEGGKKAFESKLDLFLKQVLAENTIDGMMFDTDSHAIKVMAYLEKMGKRVPDDIQVIGFDGSKSFMSAPTVLSSIRQNVPEIAKTAVSLLLKRIENPENTKTTHKTIPVTFVQGKTTK